jgi:hypothetical protein
MRKLLHYFTVIGAVTILVSCGPVLTAERVSQVKSGMTPAEVKAILGSPTESTSQSMVIVTGATWTYREGTSEVDIVFVNDKVIAIQSKVN